MSEHTPAPWTIGFEKGVSCGLAERNPGYHIVTAPCPPFAFGAAVAAVETEANAHLIAAAPELLVAAKQAVTAMEHAGVGFCESALRAAIAKAEGAPK